METFAHGFCLLWDRNLIVWSVITNGLIAITYFAIPFIIYTLAVAGNFKLPKNYRNTLLAFACFIFFCGTGHLIDIVLIWWPFYWLKIVWDGLTAAANLTALFYLIPVARRFMDFMHLSSSKLST